MQEKIRSSLEKAGLTQGEINVYLALIKTGQSTVGPIIEKSRISSSKVYIILDKLIQKGIVTYIIKEKTKYFQAAPPIALIEYVENREKELSDTKDSLKDTVKLIEKTQKKEKDYEEARIYRGFRGLRTGLLEAIATIPKGGKYYFFSIGYQRIEKLRILFQHVINETHRRGIDVYGIAHDNDKPVFSKLKNYNMRYTDIRLPSDVGIIGEYATIIVWTKSKEPILYLIHSSTLVKSHLDFFNRMWKIAKK